MQTKIRSVLILTMVLAGVIVTVLVTRSSPTQAAPPQVPNTNPGNGTRAAHITAVTWNTFLGSASQDKGAALTQDVYGNLYVAGSSDAPWGNPVHAHNGYGWDLFVAKLDSNGTLLWNTFLGADGWSQDGGNAIAVDDSGNVYVAGHSYATWGTPRRPHAGGADAFVVKLNAATGVHQWNTFLGSNLSDWGNGLVVIGNSIYVGGEGEAGWGAPLNTHAGGYDGFVAKLDTAGTLQWHTFLGSPGEEGIKSITNDTWGALYIAGYSSAAWGNPVRAHAGDYDGFAAKLDANGSLQWNTFLGSNQGDGASGIAWGDSKLYVSGHSAAWGNPVHAHTGGQDAFVAKLDGNGVLQWNTFVGSADDEDGYATGVDASGNIFVTATSHGSQTDFVAQFDAGGALQANTQLGAPSGWDDGFGLVTPQTTGVVYVARFSGATWGNPVHPFAGNQDAYVAAVEKGSTAVPTLAVFPQGLLFEMDDLFYTTLPQSFFISNVGLGSLAWSVTSDSAWLTIDPAEGLIEPGDGPAEVSVYVDYDGHFGVYEGALTITAAGAQNSPQTVEATLVVDSHICPGATIYSVSNGAWDTVAPWQDVHGNKRQPVRGDIVYVEGHAIDAGKPHVTYTGGGYHVKGLCNAGLLYSQEWEHVRFTAADFITNTAGAQIRADLGGMVVLAPYNFKVHPGGLAITNYGSIKTIDAVEEYYSAPSFYGVRGGDIFLMGGTITNAGLIQAGHGSNGNSDGERSGKGGDGGSVDIHAYIIRNLANIRTGNGGHSPEHYYEESCYGHRGGDGGDISLYGWEVFCAIAEAGEAGTGCLNGYAGSVYGDPHSLTLAGAATQIRGRNVVLYGNEGFHLDLRDLPTAAISVTQSITLAVGHNGAVDLSRCASQALQAGAGVFIASDVITHEIDLDLIAGGAISTTGSADLAFVFLDGPDVTSVQPGQVISTTLGLRNGGPITDTYTLALADSAGWLLSGLSPTTTLAAQNFATLTFTLSVPGSPLMKQDTITVTATSQTNPAVTTVHSILAFIPELQPVYLPLVLR
ncbi:MAG: SBBP repeat-containing protein [Anaerolineae bacterium]|nr:SBBP repeat-containing protein [Anaerolineae bacterium]